MAWPTGILEYRLPLDDQARAAHGTAAERPKAEADYLCLCPGLTVPDHTFDPGRGSLA